MRCQTKSGEIVTLPGMKYSVRLLHHLIEAQRVMPSMRISIKHKNGLCDICAVSSLCLDEEETIKLNAENP